MLTVQNFKNNIKNSSFIDILTAISPFIVIAVYYLTKLLEIKSICLWKIITGHNCIGCGITHAIILLLKGNIKEAISHNALVLVVFPLLLYAWSKFIYKKFINKKG